MTYHFVTEKTCVDCNYIWRNRRGAIISYVQRCNKILAATDLKSSLGEKVKKAMAHKKGHGFYQEEREKFFPPCDKRLNCGRDYVEK